MATAVKRNDTIASVQAVFDDNATLTARVDELERERDGFEESRDFWKERAELAETGKSIYESVSDTAQAKVRELEAALAEARSVADLRIKSEMKAVAERDAARAKAEEMEVALSEAESERDLARAEACSWQELQDQVSTLQGELAAVRKASQHNFDAAINASCEAAKARSQPDGLSAILRELAEEGLRIHVIIETMASSGRFYAQCGVNADSFDHIDAAFKWIEGQLLSRYPTSSFARRRAEATVEPVDPLTAMFADNPAPWIYDEDMGFARDVNRDPVMVTPATVAAVNAYQPTQAAEPISMLGFQQVDHPSPAAADPVMELLDAGEWSVKSEPYSSAYCVMAGNEFFCHCTNDDLDQFVALCAIVNRYRAIESAVNGSSFVRETIMSNLGGSTWESLHAALRPLLRTSEKEA